MFKVKKHVNAVVLVFILLTFNIYQHVSGVSIVDFKQVNVSWGYE